MPLDLALADQAAGDELSFELNDIMKAYDTFGNAAKKGALKVVLTNGAPG
jgi:hypothetical protein